MPAKAESAGFHHPRVRQARLLKQKKHRAEQRCFLVEGAALVEAALDANAELRALFVRGDALGSSEQLISRVAERGIAAHVVDARTLASLSTTREPQGVVAVAAFLHRDVAQLAPLLPGREPRAVLVLHDLSDPGNAGTLIRCADAFRAAAVCFGPASVDPYNDKVLRASAGALFRVPIIAYERWQALVGEFKRLDVAVLAADASGSDVRSVAAPQRCALLVGNERHGLSAIEAQDVALRLAVPHAAESESLNAGVAGAILLYEIARAIRLL